MKDRLWKKWVSAFVRPFIRWYLKSERETTIDGFLLRIKPGVFHPRFFFSSIYLSDFTKTLNLQHKSFLEIGGGSGLISLQAFRKNALVTCVDIDPKAIDCVKTNLQLNFKDIQNFLVLQSDVFSAVPNQAFDYTLINPPYFFKAVRHDTELAWNCGAHGEYFIKLFRGIRERANLLHHIYMILADNCDLERIRRLASDHGLSLRCVQQKKIKWETNFIYAIEKH